MTFRYKLEEYSKITSTTYGPDLQVSHSMQLSYSVTKETIEKYFKGSIKILEIGGGFGSVTDKLGGDGHNTTNITNDIKEYLVMKEKGKNVELTDMHNLPFSEEFDLVLISHVYEHSFAPFVLMTELNEVLKLKGKVIIIVPNQEDKWVFEDYHYIVPTSNQLLNLANKGGFSKLLLGITNYEEMDHLVYIGEKAKRWKE